MGMVFIFVICASLMAACRDAITPASNSSLETTTAATVTTITTAANTSGFTTTVRSTTTTKAQEKTIEKKTTAKAPVKTSAKTTTKKTSVVIPSPTAKVYKATAAKKVVTTTKKKVTATTAKKTEAHNYSPNAGLTDTEVLWAQQKANEYIKTLKGVILDPSAGGYTLSSGIPSKCTTKEKLLADMKEAIDCDYESSLEADWHNIGMYVKMDKDYNGVWAYTIMNECYG